MDGKRDLSLKERSRLSRVVTAIVGDRVVLQELNDVEMERAQELIDKEHPLQNIPIQVTLPCLKPIRRWLPKCIPKQHSDSEDDSENDEDGSPSSRVDT